MAIIDLRGPSCHEKWNKLLDENPKRNGPSPGGASAKLGITRQGVRDLAKAGYLDMYRLFHNWVQLRASEIYISNESIDRYLEMKRRGEVKPGPK